jgi:hypothetical protein
MTLRQREIFLAVARHMPAWFRARSSGERVTLASLYRVRMLERRAWRGVEGSANAAYEYHLSAQAIAALKLATKGGPDGQA